MLVPDGAALLRFSWPVISSWAPPAGPEIGVASRKSQFAIVGGRKVTSPAISSARVGARRTVSRELKLPFERTTHVPTTASPSRPRSSGRAAPGCSAMLDTRFQSVSAPAVAGSAAAARITSEHASRSLDTIRTSEFATRAVARGGCERATPDGAGRRTPRASGRSRPRRRSAATRRCGRASRVSVRTRSSSRCRSAPPPASMMPRSMMSDASSGGVLSSVDLMASTICESGSSSASRTSWDDSTTVFGRPVTRSRPRISHCASSAQGRRRADLELDLLGGLRADQQLVLALHVLDDRLVELVAADADGLRDDDAAEGDHRDLGRAAADVHDHVAGRLGDRQPGADRGGHGLLDQVGLARAGGQRGLLHRALLDARHPGGHADDDARVRPAVLVHLVDEVAEHLLRHVEVGDDAVLERADGADRPGVRPSMRFASTPTACTSPVRWSMATTDGSLSTMPRPRTYTSVFAVPRSTAISRPPMPPSHLDRPIAMLPCCEDAARGSGRPRRILQEHRVPHTVQGFHEQRDGQPDDVGVVAVDPCDERRRRPPGWRSRRRGPATRRARRTRRSRRRRARGTSPPWRRAPSAPRRRRAP